MASEYELMKRSVDTEKWSVPYSFDFEAFGLRNSSLFFLTRLPKGGARRWGVSGSAMDRMQWVARGTHRVCVGAVRIRKARHVAMGVAGDGTKGGGVPGAGGIDDASIISIGSVVRRMRMIVAFAVPVLLVPIADPLMSLIDVIFLGQFSTSLNVAGLSPATLIFNFLFCTLLCVSCAILGSGLGAARWRHSTRPTHSMAAETRTAVSVYR